jgi:hypothetical protein
VACRNPTATPPPKRKLQRLEDLPPEKRERIAKLLGVMFRQRC